MINDWKRVLALGCTGLLLFGGCGNSGSKAAGGIGMTPYVAGDASDSTADSSLAQAVSNEETFAAEQTAAESHKVGTAGQKGSGAGSFEGGDDGLNAASSDAAAMQIGVSSAKPDPDDPDKEETVHVKADAAGKVSEVTVDNVLHVYDSESIVDYSDLFDIKNTEGDEEFTQNGNNITWQNLGQDIKYEGASDKEVPISVAVTYWLDGSKVSPEELAGASGHVKMRFDYENKTSMTVAVHDKSYTVKVPFITMTAMILPADTFAHIEVTNGRAMNLEDQNMVIGYALPGLADSMRLCDFEPTEEVELPSFVEVECDAENFELAFTATVAANGLFKDIEDDNLDDIDELTDNMKELNDASKEMVDGAAQLLSGTEEFESGLVEYVSAVSQMSTGMSQLADGIAQLSANKGQLYEGSAALTDGLAQINKALPESLTVAGVTGDQKLADILTALAEDAKVLAEAITTLKGEQEWEKVFEQALSYVNLMKTAYAGVQTELNAAEAEYNSLREDIAADVQSSADAIGASAGSAANAAANEALENIINELAYGIDLSEAGLTDEQENIVRSQIAASLYDIDISENVAQQVSSDAYSEIENKILEIEEKRIAHVRAAKAYLDGISDSAADHQEELSKLDSEALQKACEDMKNQFLALTEYTDDMDKLKDSADQIQKMYAELRGGIDQLAAGSGQLTQGISEFNSGIDSLYSGALLLEQGTATLESYGDPLLTGVSALTEGMAALYEGIQTFDEEAISELTDLAGDDLLNLSSRIRALKICDTSYQTFSGLAQGRKGCVRFIIETDEITGD